MRCCANGNFFDGYQCQKQPGPTWIETIANRESISSRLPTGDGLKKSIQHAISELDALAVIYEDTKTGRELKTIQYHLEGSLMEADLTTGDSNLQTDSESHMLPNGNPFYEQAIHRSKVDRARIFELEQANAELKAEVEAERVWHKHWMAANKELDIYRAECRKLRAALENISKWPNEHTEHPAVTASLALKEEGEL
jgi:hypothetical protein